MSNFNKLLVIIFISLLSVFIAFPKDFKLFSFDIKRSDINVFGLKRSLDLKLGLDLQGGSHLVFDIDTSQIPESEKNTSLESLKEVVSKRVNLFGVSEPNIQLAQFEGKNRLIVDLPGVEDTQNAIEIVGKTAQLKFMELDDQQNLVETQLTGSDVSSARVSFDTVSSQPVVALEFTDQGADKFAQITEKNKDKVVPILLDDQIISAPVVQEKITGGNAQISGDFSLEEAKYLSLQLNAGALPAPMSLVEQTTIGPSLGEESIEKSIKAGVAGVGLVALLMIVLYGKLGVVAVVGLGLFAAYSIAIFKLVPVVITLPGIAGFLLSVGMAVDANILIFERYREEIANGLQKAQALENGFGRAWDSIRDANVATLFTAFVLANPFNWGFLHTSGPVRGFAITLSMGIFISLFTGVFISRTLLRLVIKDE